MGPARFLPGIWNTWDTWMHAISYRQVESAAVFDTRDKKHVTIFRCLDTYEDTGGWGSS